MSGDAKHTLDMIFLLLLIGNASLYLPQIMLLLKTKTSQNVSFLTYVGFMIVQTFAVLNGIYYHDIVFCIGSSLGLLASSTVVSLTGYYRLKKSKTA